MMIRCLVLFALIIQSTLAQKPPGNAVNPGPPAFKWPTLSGGPPAVIARGGFSGTFPDSSDFAIDMAMSSTMGEIVMYCDLQLTKDGTGICQPDLTLDNTTNIATVFPAGRKTYDVNGKKVAGWFAVDFLYDDIFNNVTVVQNIMSRPSVFDLIMPLQTLDDVLGRKSVRALWVNVQHDLFYALQKHSPATYLQKVLAVYPLTYISSPEIGFLKAMQGPAVSKARTKLIFRFLGATEVEPTTRQTYGAILKDLQAVKAYASGILVPKEYIWPISPDHYLGAPTTLVADAHKLGLEVHVSGFANDFAPTDICYNYTYDPVLEYLQFIDNGQFAVDGLVTDFPPTAAESVLCFTHNANAPKAKTAKALVISHNGASGVFPGSTDLAYQQAVTDGADIIDCTVQMTQDGVAFCLGGADLSDLTTAMPTFMSRSSTVPEIQPNNGIFSFDLSWDEIQTLKPQIESPFGGEYGLPRDPLHKNSGKFISLNDFLEFAKTKAVSGVLINIENAAYLASKKGLDVVGTVSKALSNATFDKQATQQVIIKSDDTSVLSQFKSVPTYKRVLNIKEKISNAPKPSVDEVKKYADGVVVTRASLIPTADSFLIGNTTVMQEMHAANLSVYVSVLKNEYLTLAFDYYSDPTLELATYIAGLEVDGVITEFPGTANRYIRSRCFSLNGDGDQAILPAQPGALVGLLENPGAPVQAPAPALDADDIVDPPLPAVAGNKSAGTPTGAPSSTKSGSSANSVHLGYSLLALLLLRLLFSMGH